jgi:hypothetical protein
MKTPIALPALAVLFAILTQAQQTPSTSQPSPVQAQTAAASTVPCKSSAPQPRKPGWLEKKTKALACKQNKQACDLPSSPNDIFGGTPDAKPCPTNTAASPSPLKAQPIPALPTNTATKPVYVCPPKATLIPGFPYCMYADHSTVDAIALPPSLSAPASPAPAAPAPAQH